MASREAFSLFLKLVQMKRLELIRPYGHQHLKLACLPIPPHLRYKVAGGQGFEPR